MYLVDTNVLSGACNIVVTRNVSDFDGIEQRFPLFRENPSGSRCPSHLTLEPWTDAERYQSVLYQTS